MRFLIFGFLTLVVVVSVWFSFADGNFLFASLTLVVVLLLVVLFLVKKLNLLTFLKPKKKFVAKLRVCRKCQGQPNNITLSRQVCWPAHATKRHTLVLGTSGSGKTQLLYNFIRQTPTKVLFVNGKYEPTMGQDITQLNKPFWQSTLTGNANHLYNPFKNKTLSEALSLLMELEHYSEVKQRDTGGYVHYLNVRQNTLRTVLELFRKLGLATTIRNLLKGLTPTGFSALLKKARTHPKTTVRLLKEHRSTLGEIRSHIHALSKISCLAKGTDGSSLSDFFADPTSLWLFNLNLAGVVEGQTLTQVVVYDLRQTLFTAKHRNTPLVVVLDEFGSFVTPHTKVLVEQARSKNTTLLLSCQGLSQLDAFAPTFRRNVLNNTANVFAFTTYDPVDAELTCGVLGVSRTKKRWRKSNLPVKQGVTPEELAALPQGTCFLRTVNHELGARSLVRVHLPIVTRKL